MKVVPFKTCRAVFTWLWMCPPEDNVSERQKMYYVMFGGFNFALMTLHFIASVVYFVKNGVDDINNSLYALNQVSGFFDVLYMMIVARLFRFKISKILTELEKIYKLSKFIMESCKMFKLVQFID